MAGNDVINEIKRNVDTFIGKKVRLKANQGRKKIVELEGVLESTYPKIFVIRLNEKPGITKRVSYTYADLLTESVELSVWQKDHEERIGCVGL
ncbi:MAG TPA: Veg protein [Firmicutes bacterium]|nr:Veg protein [Bacillota bacterium]